ncbi:exosortase K [Hymenobacter norwichensis]|uniref:exosortase K n=1 Tax=Hymenobacter norwichensis TaxID=223903 RepID=UPI0003B703F6|nr:exosortase K [Hymenobacter norwichensis]
MLPSRCWLPYGLVAGAFIALKFGYMHAATSHLLWLLWPTDVLVGGVLGSVSSFEPARGFVHADLHIAIDKSCSGFNFWLLCSGLLLVSALRHQEPMRTFQNSWLLLLPVLGYVLTLLVNTSRILTAVSIQRVFPQAARQLPWLHQAEGVLVYLVFLLLIYSGFELLCHRYLLRYAKSA